MENDPKKIDSCLACGFTKHEFFTSKRGFNLFKCRNCGHLCIFPFNFNTEVIYTDDYFSGANNGSGYIDYDLDKEAMRSVFEKYIKIIKGNLKNGSNDLLDVGAATGFFMQLASSFGFKVKGIEISDYATSVAKNKGLEVQAGTLLKYDCPPKTFDVITMWDVIEHFPNPEEDLKKTYFLLKKGGILAVNTPDSGSFYARILGKYWHLLVPPEHVNYFNRRSIKLFLERMGFEIIVVKNIGKSFTLEYIFHTLSVWLKIGLFQKVAHFFHNSAFFSRLSLPINFFDNMFVLAIKRDDK